MLAPIKQRCIYHAQAAIESLQRLTQQPIASFLTALVIAAALTVSSIFLLFSHGMDQWMLQWRQTGHLSLVLNPKLTLSDQKQLLNTLLHNQHIDMAVLKTAADGLQELQHQVGMEDIMRYLPNNPLPTIIEITPKKAFSGATQLQDLRLQLQGLAFVDQVQMNSEWIQTVDHVIHIIQSLTRCISVLLGLAVIVIISRTLSLAVQTRYDEIRVLKLIGATDSYIERNFLYTGFWYAVFGGLIAVLLTNIFLYSLRQTIMPISSSYSLSLSIHALSVKQAYDILLLAIALGWIGAKVAVKIQIGLIKPYN